MKKGFSKTILLIMGVFILGSCFYIYSNLNRRIHPEEAKFKAGLMKARIFSFSCLARGGKVNAPSSGLNICTKESIDKNQVWPDLPLGWTYSSGNNLLSKENFSVKAISSKKEITCTSKGCK